MAPVLLPVLKGLHTDTHQVYELRLRETGSFANRPSPRRLDFKPAKGFPPATQNRSAFAHAFEQFFDILVCCQKLLVSTR
jgi:hypothetical protein